MLSVSRPVVLLMWRGFSFTLRIIPASRLGEWILCVDAHLTNRHWYHLNHQIQRSTLVVRAFCGVVEMKEL